MASAVVSRSGGDIVAVLFLQQLIEGLLYRGDVPLLHQLQRDEGAVGGAVGGALLDARVVNGVTGMAEVLDQADVALLLEFVVSDHELFNGGVVLGGNEQTHHVQLGAAQVGGYLDTRDGGDALLAGLFEEVGESRDGIVIGEGHRQTQALGLGNEGGRGQGAVGMGRMDMQVTGHGTPPLRDWMIGYIIS